MSAILFIVTVFVAGYGLRIAYGLANSLHSGSVRLHMQGREIIVTRTGDPVRFWALWLLGASLVVVAVAYVARRAGLL
jgi:hypothetical protein